MFYFLLIVVWKLGEKNHWLTGSAASSSTIVGDNAA